MTWRIPAPLDVYIGVLAAIGAVVVGTSAIALASTPHGWEWAGLTLLAMLASRFPLRVPGTNAWFSIADTFFVTSALLFGPAPATVAIAVDSLVMSYRLSSKRRRLLFNGSAPAVAFWIGAQVFIAWSGLGPLYGTEVAPEELVLPLAAFAAVYFVLNSGMTAVAVGLEKRRSAAAVFRSHFGVVSLNWFAAASVAFILVLFAQYLSFLAMAAVVPLIAVIHLAMRSWSGRLEDADRHVATVDRLYLSTIEALATAIEAKDGVTSSHIHRVQKYATGLARALGPLDDLSMKAIQAAALLHDTGKLAVPERILNKPGKLTAAEFETMKLHVDVGADILSSIDFPYPVVPIVRAHHENWDGSGYPNGLKGSEIPIGARILSVVDCYDALTSDRPYRSAMADHEAMGIIRARRGTMYDPVVVDAFECFCREVTPVVVQPQMQKAIQQISRSMAPVETSTMATAVAEGPESMRALANLARLVSGRPTVADVAALAWTQMRQVVPGASCAFFVPEPAADAVAARFVAGDAGSVLQGLQMKIGDRMSGWVAANLQPVVNSEAQLDLGAEAALAGLDFCTALPMVSDGCLAGVLSVYGAGRLDDAQVQALQVVLPHLAQMFQSVEARASEPVPARAQLRVVASR